MLEHKAFGFSIGVEERALKLWRAYFGVRDHPVIAQKYIHTA